MKALKNARIQFLIVLGLFIAATFIYLQLQPKKPVEAAWHDESWSYRQVFTATNGSAYNATNVPYRIIMDTATPIAAGKMKSNGTDIRVVDSQGKTVRFQVEQSTLNTTQTGIWFEAVVPANTSALYYVYYGNNQANTPTFTSDVNTVVGNGTTVEMKDGFGYTTSVTGGQITDIRKNSTNLGVNGNVHHTTGYPGNWWDDRPMTQTLLASGPLFVEVKFNDSNYGSYSDFGSNVKMFKNGFTEVRVFMTYNTSGTDQLYYYLNFDNGTRNSVWVNGSEAVVDQAPDSGILVPANLGDSWFGQRWTGTGVYGGTIVRKNGSDWVQGNTSAQSSYYQTNYSVSAAYTNGTSREIRYGIFAGDGGLAEMTQKGSAYGDQTVTLNGSEEKSPSPIAYWKFDEGQGVTTNDSVWKKTGTTTNYITNPSFEAGTASWGTFYGATIAQVATASAVGNFAAQVTTTGGNTGGALIVTTTSTQGTWTGSGYVKAADSASVGRSASVLLRLVYSDASSTDSTATVVLTNQWQRLTTTQTTNGAKTLSNIQLMFRDLSNQVAFATLVDGAQLEISSISNPYCDGSQTGNGTHVWNGTANASSSTCDMGTEGSISGTAWRTGDQCISGKCLYFDGSTSYIQATAQPVLHPDLFTISMWVNPTQYCADANVGCVIGGNYNSNQDFIFYISNTGKISLRPHPGTDAKGNTSIPINQWSLVTATYDGSNIKIYLNGAYDGGGASTGMTHFTNTFVIGKASWSASNYFKGILDEVKLYEYARTAAQVKADYLAKGSGSVKGTSVTFGSNSKNSDSLSNGLVGYWKLDEASGNPVDASGNGNNGTWAGSGAAHYSTGKFGNGGGFNGSDDVVNMGNPASLNTLNTMTVNAWVKTSINNVTFANSTIAGNNSRYFLSLSDYSSSTPRATGYVYNGSVWGYIKGNTAVNDGAWHMVTMTYDGSYVRVYHNGVLDATPYPITGTLGAAGNFTIGAYQASPSYYTNATIDETRVYNRALSDAEISKLYSYAPGPFVQYNFEEGAGTTFIADVSGNGNNGTINGTITAANWVNGQFGKAYSFNGTNTWLQPPALDFMGKSTSEFTLSAWINPRVTAGTIFHNHNMNTGWSTGLVGFTGGKLSYNVYALGFVTETGTTPTNAWTYVTLTRDASGNNKLYKNGTLVASNTGSYSPSGSAQTIGIGRTRADCCQFDSPGWYNGKIDEVKIYNYARTQTQIIEDMNGGHPVGGSPIGSQALYWKLDEGNGTTTNSSGATTVTGTLACTGGTCTIPTWTNSGKFGKAVTFSSSGTDRAYITTATVSPVNLPVAVGSKITVSTWMNPLATQTGGGWYVRNGTGVDENYAIHLANSPTNGNYPISLEYYDGTWRSISTAGQYVPQAVWSHVVVVISQGQWVKVYVNGVFKEQIAWVGSSSALSTSSFNIGGHAGTTGQYFNGTMDEFKVYGTELTADEIKLDYNRGQTMVLGSASVNSSGVVDNSSSAQYCIPGDSTSCNSPIIDWELDEKTGTTAKDTSGNGNNGTFKNNVLWGLGKVGSGVLLDGISAHIDGPINKIASTGTLEMWIRPNDTTTRYAYAFDTGPDQAPGCVGQYGQFDGASKFVVNNYDASPNWATLTSNTTFVANNWYHIAVVTQTGTGNYRLYVNGVLDTSGTTATINQFGQFTIGNYHSDCVQATDDVSNPIDGSIDQVRYFNYARTPAQIAWDYNQGKPVGWWKFDECQGSAINDASGNGGTGTLSTPSGVGSTQDAAGTCTDGVTTHAWYNGRTGKYNSSINLDGIDDYISVPNPSADDFGTGPMSVSAWIKTPSVLGTQAQIVDNKFAGSNGAGFNLQLDSTGKIYFRVANGSTQATSGVSSTVYTDNIWHHVVGVLERGSPDTLKVYVDGKLILSNGITSGWNITSSGTLFIGAYSSGINNANFNGQIDDVRLFNYALNATQVGSVFNQGSAIRFGPPTGTP